MTSFLIALCERRLKARPADCSTGGSLPALRESVRRAGTYPPPPTCEGVGGGFRHPARCISHDADDLMDSQETTGMCVCPLLIEAASHQLHNLMPMHPRFGG